MRRTMKQTGVRELNNSISFLTQWADLTAILDDEGDLLLSTSDDVRPTLTIEQFTQFYGAVMALHAEQLNKKEKKT